MLLTRQLPHYKDGSFVAEIIHRCNLFVVGFKEVLQESGEGTNIFWWKLLNDGVN